ncbi:MAG: HK97 gp10 family phage protein [Clostridia bacterium]
MSKTIKVDSLSKEIMKALENYSDDISEVVEEVANKVGKEAVDEIKEISPKKRGRYAKGWRLKKDKLGKNRYSVKIHNRTDYQRTHLLEFGHVTRNGGRTKAIPHIRPVEEKYSKEYEKELKQKIGGIK